MCIQRSSLNYFVHLQVNSVLSFTVYTYIILSIHAGTVCQKKLHNIHSTRMRCIMYSSCSMLKAIKKSKYFTDRYTLKLYQSTEQETPSIQLLPPAFMFYNH